MAQDQVGGVSDASMAVASTTDCAYARKLVQAYFAMVTLGCQRGDCTNTNCCSNPQTPALRATEAAIKSIYFATHAPVPLCIEFEQQQEETLVTTEAPQLPQLEENELTPESQPALEEENQIEEALPSIGDRNMSKEELQPETSEAEVLKTQQPESVTIQSVPTSSSPVRKSTPRRRLSVAVQLDNGINKNHELLAKRPTVVTRVAVQPKHKSAINSAAVSLLDDVTATVAMTEAVDVPAQQQEHEQAAPKLPNSVKDARQRQRSRPKEKLFDAIKRSFSRSKKAPLGSA
ncbi:hypothetical protein PHYPSEUDO_008059 [Phytophthora pseudosyringae]|uniref:Ubiquitin-protein ligase E3A N-terminal zinc-binding domain-containing protein n=1 Tax=Phytophthora pseudosyringae TaxID=221518 RepID=A0A8T1VFI5_9STRA|nr:hypothetical protein PHYPSEUDO_008059 [Phytophthora pseudosyringae]